MQWNLNQSHREAVDALTGPLLVLAGAGTGKTRVVTLRIANLINQGVAADRILAVTFTTKAAQEMRIRVGELVKGTGERKPLVSTFHSLCVKILRRNIELIGYPSRFTIYDASDQESLARQVLREIRVHDSQLRPRDCVRIISRWKTNSIRPDHAAQIADNDREHLAAMAYRRYQQSMKRGGGVVRGPEI